LSSAVSTKLEVITAFLFLRKSEALFRQIDGQTWCNTYCGPYWGPLSREAFPVHNFHPGDSGVQNFTIGAPGGKEYKLQNKRI